MQHIWLLKVGALISVWEGFNDIPLFVITQNWEALRQERSSPLLTSTPLNAQHFTLCDESIVRPTDLP